MSRLSSSFLLLLLAALAVSSAAHGGQSDSDEEAPPGNLRSRSLILVKIWCLILVFAGTFAGGISPYFLKWNEGFLVLGTQFAGGVFLGTALMHFLSDANETFGDLTEVEYPFAFMLACAGYLLTMLADCMVASVVAGGKSFQDVEADRGGDVDDGKSAHPRSNEQVDSGPDRSVKSVLQNASSLGDSILLILALCFHSVFEGIAIGIAETKEDAWKALWTVSLHKVFAAIAMSIALLRIMPNRPLLSCMSYAFAFAISSPIGVAIGIIIDATTQGRVADWIFAISMGLACGIFIYVSINHLLCKGYKPQKNTGVDSPLKRWLAVMLGTGVIAVVMIWDT